MTDVTPYTPPPGPTRPDLLDPTTDSWVASVADVARLAEYVCNTPFVPAGLRGNAPATAATILYGREIGIPPITALQTMHVVNGRVGMAAELMRARVLAAGHELEVVESTAAVCRMRGRRRGSQTWTEVSWSKGDAQQAGLRGDNWTKYPRAMLTARASAELCRLVFPDVTHGMAALEELDGATPPPPGSAPSTPKLVSRRRGQDTTPPPGEGTTTDPSPSPAVPQSPVPGEVETLPRASATPPPAGVETPSAGDPPTPPPGRGHPAPGPVVAPPPLPGEGMEPPEDDAKAQGELRGDGPATQPQIRHVMVLLRRLGVGSERAERIRIVQALTQRRVESFSQLSVTEMGHVITSLILAAESSNPDEYLRWLVDEGHVMLADREARGEDTTPPEVDPGVDE